MTRQELKRLRCKHPRKLPLLAWSIVRGGLIAHFKCPFCHQWLVSKVYHKNVTRLMSYEVRWAGLRSDIMVDS